MCPKPVERPVTVLDKEIEKEMQDLDKQVERLITKKTKEFTFELKPVFEHFPEIDELTSIISKTIIDYRIAKKMGKLEEIQTYQATIKQLKFAKEHMIRVLNMDFDKPTAKLRKMAKESKIDLKDPMILADFRVMQEQTLNEIRRLKDGKKPLTEAESQAEREKLIKERRDKMIQDAIEKQNAEREAAQKQTEKLVNDLKKTSSLNTNGD